MACQVCVAHGKSGAGHNAVTCPLGKNAREAKAKLQARRDKRRTPKPPHRVDVTLTPEDEEELASRTPDSDYYKELFQDLAEPPSDALDLTRWAQGIVGKLMFATMRGRGNAKILAQVSTMVRAIVSLHPKDIAKELKDLLEAEKRQTRPKAKHAAPMVAPVGSSQPLR